MFAILCAIGSVLLELHDVESDEPVACGEHAVDGMCCLLTEGFVNKHYAVGQLVESYGLYVVVGGHFLLLRDPRM